MITTSCVRFLKCEPHKIKDDLDKIGFHTEGQAKQSIFADRALVHHPKKQVVVKLTITVEVVEEP